MNRLDSTFERLRQEGRKALVIYATAGDPDAATSSSVFASALAAGADIVEVGVPFSDPAADGPAIQAASGRALAGGMTVGGTLEVVRRVRANSSSGIILFGYANPFLQYGARKFARDAKKAGADGVLIVDLPPEEDDVLGPALGKAGLHSIRLLAPTSTPDRMRRASESAGGFLYYVSVTGVTGGKVGKTRAVKRALTAIRRHSSLPIVVGFGIATAQEAAHIANVADGVVVGSAVVRLVEKHASAAAEAVGGFVRTLRNAIDGE